MVTVNPAKRASRSGTTALHRAHSGVTPELLSTLGFMDEQQYERLYRAQALPLSAAPRIRRARVLLYPAGLCACAALAMLFMAPHVHASEDRLRSSGQRPIQFVVVPKIGIASTPFVRYKHAVVPSAVDLARLRALAAIPSLDPTGLDDVTSAFGYRTIPFPEFHRGIDLAAPTGTPVAASADGTVTFAGWSGGFGNKVEIDHGNGYATWYAHLSRIDVTTGQHVARGSVIAAVGETGEATGPHLHYQIMLNGVAIDPAPYLRKAAGTR